MRMMLHQLAAGSCLTSCCFAAVRLRLALASASLNGSEALPCGTQNAAVKLAIRHNPSLDVDVRRQSNED